VTITVEDGLLERARARALRLGTSINAVLRDRLDEFAGGEVKRSRALADLFALAARSTGRSGGRRWSRASLYER
jgi:hypothetical protein